MGVLQEILDAQSALVDRLTHDPELPHYQGLSRERHLREYAVMLAKEAHELMDCTNWKRHKRNFMQPMTDTQLTEAREEAIDCLHLVVAALLVLGFDNEYQVLQHYSDKNKKNHARQDNGY